MTMFLCYMVRAAAGGLGQGHRGHSPSQQRLHGGGGAVRAARRMLSPALTSRNLGRSHPLLQVHMTVVDLYSAAKNMAPVAIGFTVFLAHCVLLTVTGCR